MLQPPRHLPAALRRRPPTVLVTGTASGIGLALARLLRGSGYRAVVTARESSLHQLAAAGLTETDRFLVRPLDVTVGEERRRVVAEIEERWGGVDVLVNNAGIAFRSVVEEMSSSDERLQQETNYLGPMALCRLVLPHMRHQRWGRIINVSSVGGMMAMPTMSSYSASKFALEGASEALWYEMRPWRVAVSLIRPGFVRSSSFRHVYRPSHGGEAAPEPAVYSGYYTHMERLVERLMTRALATPESVARTVLRTAGRRRPPLRVPATFDARLFYLLRRLLPRRLYHEVLYRCLPGVREWVPAEPSDLEKEPSDPGAKPSGPN